MFPRTKSIRPATDRLKETIFDILGGTLPEMKVLDLYAGTGSLGIEALSRGAAAVAFVDRSPLAVSCIFRNLRELDLLEKAQVLKMDALGAIARLERSIREGARYDVIFIDPPYNKGLVKKTLLAIDRFDILSARGTIVIEHARQEELPVFPTLEVERTNHYGITCLSFLHKKG